MLILNLFLRELGVVVEKIMLHTLKNIKHIFLAVFAYKVVCVDDKFSKPVVEKHSINKFIETVLKGYDYFKSVIKENKNKNNN